MSKERRWEVMYYVVNDRDDKEWNTLDVFATDWNDALVKAKDYLDPRFIVYYIYSAREMIKEGEFA